MILNVDILRNTDCHYIFSELKSRSILSYIWKTNKIDMRCCKGGIDDYCRLIFTSENDAKLAVSMMKSLNPSEVWQNATVKRATNGEINRLIKNGVCAKVIDFYGLSAVIVIPEQSKIPNETFPKMMPCLINEKLIDIINEKIDNIFIDYDLNDIEPIVVSYKNSSGKLLPTICIYPTIKKEYNLFCIYNNRIVYTYSGITDTTMLVNAINNSIKIYTNYNHNIADSLLDLVKAIK